MWIRLDGAHLGPLNCRSWFTTSETAPTGHDSRERKAGVHTQAPDTLRAPCYTDP